MTAQADWLKSYKEKKMDIEKLITRIDATGWDSPIIPRRFGFSTLKTLVNTLHEQQAIEKEVILLRNLQKNLRGWRWLEKKIKTFNQTFCYYTLQPQDLKERISGFTYSSSLPYVVMNGPGRSGRGYLHPILCEIFQSEHKIYEEHLWWYNDAQNQLPSIFQTNKAKHIYVYRDPRDHFVTFPKMCLEEEPEHVPDQFKGQTVLTQEMILDNAKKPWREAHDISHKRYADHVRYFSNLSYSMSLMFEQLLLNPKKTITDLIRFMEYPIDENKINAAIKNNPPRDKIGIWKDHFNDEVEAEFKRQMGDIVSYLGYETDENWSYKEDYQ